MPLTGFTDLDQLTGGLSNGDLIVLASRPHMGQSSLALSIAANVIRREPESIYGEELGMREVRRAVAFFSLQSSREQVVQRMISLVGHFPVRDLRSGNIQVEDWPRLVRTVAEVSRAPLFLNDSTDLSLREMRTALEETRRGLRGTDVELGLVIIDRFRLMLPPIRSESDYENHAADILRGLKILARDIRLPVVLLTQLPSGLERRHDRRPLLSDFELSEPMEQFADMVMFLYRDEYYNPDSDDKGIAEIIVGKHRNGPTGKVQLAFLESFGRFASLARRR
jgi:replicative DNA helicase